MSAAIEIRDVSKRFRLYHERYHSLKERVVHFGRTPSEEFWALDQNGINVDVEEGTTVGLLGHNGSGKSTLLKCIAGILQPTGGEIITRGRLAALLELGAGFHPELTGRENIFMNASILGLSRKEIEARFDEIVAFAELEKFIDMQVRHYSSGMYVRLGFAVAVNVEPDILLVDEVLAVGDESFQRKCIDRVAKFQREGRTILFVTHGADLVRRICNRAVVLDHGVVVSDAEPGVAVRQFRESLLQGGQMAPPSGLRDDRSHLATGQVRITKVSIEHPGTLVGRTWLLPHEPMTIRVAYHARQRTPDLNFGIGIYDESGNHLFGTNTRIMGVPVPPADGDGELAFEFEDVSLLDGTYLMSITAQTVDEGTVYDWQEQKYQFSVMNPSREIGIVAFPVEVRFADRAMQSVEEHGA